MLLILLMLLVLLCFKCHRSVSCSISKALQFLSACSAKAPSQGPCIFLIVISSLARAPGTVSSSFIGAHHSEFSTLLCHSSLPLLQMQTPSHFQSPSQFNPASYHSWDLLPFRRTHLCFVDCSLHFCFSSFILLFPL